MISSSNRGALHERLNTLVLLILIFGAILGMRVVQMQVVERAQFSLAAERNRTRIIYQTAPRGRFYDRNGVIIASNRPVFSLVYQPAKSNVTSHLGPLARDLAKHIKLSSKEILETLQRAVKEGTSVRIAENLSSRTMFRLSELKTVYRGVDLIVEARRYYPFNNFASHLLGYMGKMDPRSWKKLKKEGYRVYNRIGKTGLERIFERDLKGRDGGIRMEVDAQGKLKRVLERIPWKPGSNVHLTLDASIQRAAEEGLRASSTGRGAVVVLDPRDGSILALASAPDFDPNAFLSTDPEVLKKHFADFPEFNNAIAGTYPPGSIFKIIVGAAGLNEEKITIKDEIYCPGYFKAGRRVFLCWNKKGHKKMSWYKGFANSCDVYFYRMGLKMGGDVIERYSKKFGLGTKTARGFRGEKRGNLFGPAAKRPRSWFNGDTLNLSIGQGELLVTPIQMAVMVAAVANRGTLWVPHFTNRIDYAGGRADYIQKPEKISSIDLKEKVWDQIQVAMQLVVASGTARGVRIPGINIAGKTGTAQNPGEDHAWFVSYASRPGEVPSIASAVLVQNGGHGSSQAAPIARKIYLAAFGIEERRWKRKVVKRKPEPVEVQEDIEDLEEEEQL